ncbi:hypothetical protein VDGD_21084 [Verticillium dahliae]|nr:hypothetical protein VDGD_21084 [Verticillium dahliae]
MQLLRDNLTLWTSSEAEPAQTGSGESAAPKEAAPEATEAPAAAASTEEAPKAAE